MKTSSRRQLIREAINLFSSCLWSGCLLLTYSCSELPPNVTLAQWSWWAQSQCLALMLFLRHRKRKKKCGEEQPEGLAVRSHRQDVAEVTTVGFFRFVWGFFWSEFWFTNAGLFFFF